MSTIKEVFEVGFLKEICVWVIFALFINFHIFKNKII
jgi:hypothetical protein